MLEVYIKIKLIKGKFITWYWSKVREYLKGGKEHRVMWKICAEEEYSRGKIVRIYYYSLILSQTLPFSALEHQIKFLILISFIKFSVWPQFVSTGTYWVLSCVITEYAYELLTNNTWSITKNFLYSVCHLICNYLLPHLFYKDLITF